MGAIEGRGFSLTFEGREYPVDSRRFTTLNTSVTQHYSVPDEMCGFPAELAEPLEITCKVNTELNSLEYLMTQQENIFTVRWSERQHKRNRRRSRRNKARANGTRRTVKFRKNCHVLRDFNCVMEDHIIIGDWMRADMRKVK